MSYKQLGCSIGFVLIAALAVAATNDGRENPAVAADPNSSKFISVFNGHDNEEADEECIYAQFHYFDNLAHTLSFYRLDATHNGHNIDPDIALNNNAVVVAWTSSDSDSEGVKARVFDPNINPLTPEIAVNSITAGNQYQPAIAIDAHGRFLVVWSSGTEGSRTVSGRFFDVSGSPLSAEFAASSSGDNFSPAAAVDPNGVFTVAWSAKPSGSSTYNVAFRQYTPDGTPKTTAVWVAQNLVNTPAVAVSMNRDRNLVIAWDARSSDAAQTDIYAQIFNSNTIPQTDAFPVNTFQTGRQEKPSVSLTDSGNFVIVWQSENADGDDDGICGRTYDPNGLPTQDEFSVNLFVYGKQHKPDVAMNADGRFLTAWQHEAQNCWLDGKHLYCEYSHEIHFQTGAKTLPRPGIYSGDLSGNSFTDFADLIWLAEHWLQWDYRRDIPDADIYPDGHTDFIDFYYIAENWMTCWQPPLPPELMWVYHQNRLTACSSRLKSIATSVVMYANDFNGRFPSTLESLAAENFLETPWPDEMFQCPAVCPHTQYSDYVYRGNDLRDYDSAYMILAYDRQNNHPNGMRNVAFADGHVKTMTEEDFLAAIEQDNAYRRTSPRLEEKPVE